MKKITLYFGLSFFAATTLNAQQAQQGHEGHGHGISKEYKQNIATEPATHPEPHLKNLKQLIN